MQGFKLIAAVVPKGAAGRVRDAAKEAGAEGGTILMARGTGVHEARRFFGMSMSTERELLLVLIDPETAEGVLDSMVRAGRLDEPAAEWPSCSRWTRSGESSTGNLPGRRKGSRGSRRRPQLGRGAVGKEDRRRTPRAPLVATTQGD